MRSKKKIKSKKNAGTCNIIRSLDAKLYIQYDTDQRDSVSAGYSQAIEPTFSIKVVINSTN